VRTMRILPKPGISTSDITWSRLGLSQITSDGSCTF
jgi:hypothetical protein